VEKQRDALSNAADYVRTLFDENVQSEHIFHTYDRTLKTVASCEEISKAIKLKGADFEVALLASWFLDAGYGGSDEKYKGKSIELATTFLLDQGYPQEGIDRVAGCIRATMIPQSPQNLAEQVVCDADMVFLGAKNFFRVNALRRVEQERSHDTAISDVEWLGGSAELFTKSQFYTRYVKKEYGKRRSKNLIQVQDQLREAIEKEKKATMSDASRNKRSALKLEKERRPDRGIETMFRVTSRNHLELSSIADHKANIMISINAIIISLVVSLLIRYLDVFPMLIIPTLMLLGISLTTIIFATLATRPKVTSGRFTKEDVKDRRVNLLFFGNFFRMDLEDFESGMKEMMEDREYLYDSMIKDIYFLGKVLGRKYLLLRISYSVFMYGLVAAVLAFAVAILRIS
jgi:predicted metal-dependent HD superfamily phosphohydrolase